jgi:D-cysteine desulfhydrase family pyridoxal phosphate-dependent enzyme
MIQMGSFPRYALCDLPTPLERAHRLEQVLGSDSPRIWIKRDDLTGLAFGGNKARKLEYLLGDAIARGADHLITEGAVQSNHARLTAAAAAKAGIGCTLVLDRRRGSTVEGNLLLDYLMGARIELVDRSEDRKPRMEQLADELRQEGRTPYLIPTGGSVPVGALGYAMCMIELANQLLAHGEQPSRIYVPTGSQGTQGGLIAGASLMSLPVEIYGVAVEHPREALRNRAAELANETLELLGAVGNATPNEVTLDDEFVGAAYAEPTEGGIEAVRLLARSEAIFLDHVYTGKAMAALIAHVRNGQLGPDDSVVFLHTGGGPSIFANREVLLAEVAR